MNFKKQYVLPLLIVVIIGAFFVYKYFLIENDSSVYIDNLVYPDIQYDEVDIESASEVVNNEVIEITQSGTYEFTGDYENTTISVDCEGIVYIVLNNANITSSDGELINVISAESVVINAAEGSINYLTQDYESSEIDKSGAVIYSKSDLVINGSGKIIIETNYNDGINGRDDVVIENVSLYIDAQEDGIVGNDYLAVTDADITVYAGNDGLKASNDTQDGNILIESGSFSIYSVCDGISAEGTLQINDGTFYIETNGGYDGVLKQITVGEGGSSQAVTDYSSKGLKSYNILINDGTFEISSYEDAIHADNDLYIINGNIEIEAGDDALHADNNLVIDYVNLYVSNTYEGIEADNITINDGVIDVIAYDDAMNNSSEIGILTINGGTIYLYSVGDGLDSNGDLLITDGTIVIENEAIYTGGDYEIDVAGEITVTGGTIVDENGDDIDYDTVMSSGSNQMTVPSRR